MTVECVIVEEVTSSSNHPQKVRQVWEEVVACVSSSSGITRRVAQCCKRYNDVRRRGKQNLAAQRHRVLGTGGGPSFTGDHLTSAEDLATSSLTPESIEGFGGLEVGVQGNALDGNAV